ESQRAGIVREAGVDLPGHFAGAAEVQADAAADEDHVGGEKSEEDRQQDADRFVHAAQVEHGQAGDDGQLHRQLPDVPGQGKVGEDGFAAGGDRGGASEDVVDEQRRAADHAGGGAEQARGDDV